MDKSIAWGERFHPHEKERAAAKLFKKVHTLEGPVGCGQEGDLRFGNNNFSMAIIVVCLSCRLRREFSPMEIAVEAQIKDPNELFYNGIQITSDPDVALDQLRVEKRPPPEQYLAPCARSSKAGLTWQERSLSAGVNPAAVKEDMDRWRVTARKEGLREGTAEFNDRVGQLVHLELQAGRGELEQREEVIKRQRYLLACGDERKAEVQKELGRQAKAEGERADQADAAMQRAFEQLKRSEREMMDIAIQEHEPAKPRPIGARARKFREDVVTRKAGETATEAAPSFEFHRGPRIVCDGNW